MGERIRVIVSGGVIQEITGIPPGIVVEVRDYDCENDDDGVQFDSVGDPCVVSEWFHEEPAR